MPPSSGILARLAPLGRQRSACVGGVLASPAVAASSILIVDDEKNILTSLQRALKVEGYDADVAGGGTVAPSP